jgi:RimJ/RimL family protein N-acetyltransferase
MNKHEQAPTIQSDRLTMRSLASEDEDFYCSLYTDAEVMRFAGAALSREVAAEGFRKSIGRMGQSSFERRVVLLIDRTTQEPIGISSVRLLRGKPGRAEVGTLLKPGKHDKGFAQECSTALISQAFTRSQIHELVAYSVPGNAAVESLLVGLGFSREKSVPSRDGYPERVSWTISRGEWAKRNAGPKSK